MNQDTDLQYGCIIPEVLAPAIDFSEILSEDFVGAPAPSAPSALAIPKTADYLKAFSAWDPLGNLKYNVCNAVVWSNTRRMITSKLSEHEVWPSRDQVYTFYRTQNPGFNPQIKNAETDLGMRIQESLDYLVKVGGPDGQRALAFARVDPTNIEDVKMALATFGSIWLGIRVYKTNSDQFENGEKWTLAPPQEKKAYGHAVVAGAYNPNFKIVTWGGVATLTPEYWHGYMPGGEPGKALPGKEKPNVFEAYVVVWPEHIGTRRFMTGISLSQLAEQYNKMTGKDMEIPTAQFNSVSQCQTTGGDGISVRLQKIDSETSYSSVSIDVTVDIKQTEVPNGTFAIEKDDLFFIKTKNTASNMVEIQRIQDPAYTKVESWVSSFHTTEASDGLWTIDNGDLYLIKTANTEEGMVEVWYASHQSNFREPAYYKSGMEVGDIGFGTYAMSGGNLYKIRDANNASGLVEVTCYKAYGDYSSKSRTHQSTGFKINDVKGKGTWSVGHNGDLFLIKTLGTASGLVELHVATAESNYQSLSHYSLGFQADQSGVWMIY
ncbi:hypothetical protein P7C71_g2771, partial [Lecanoromycetidae sp. Uapishka_2]